MKNFLTLLKLFIKQGFRRNNTSKRSKKGKVGTIILIVFCVLTMVPIYGFQLFVLASQSAKAGAYIGFTGAIFTIVQASCLIFGFIMLTNTLFYAKDNEILSTLPVKSSEIYFAKIAYVALSELMIIGSIALVMIILFGILAKLAFTYYILGLVCIILSVILALFVTSLIMTPFVSLFAKLKRSEKMTSITNIIMYLAFMVIYFLFISNITSTLTTSFEDPNATVNMINAIGMSLFFNVFMAKLTLLSITLNEGLILLAIFAVALVLAYLISSALYRKSIQIQRESGSDKIKEVGYKTDGLLSSLIKNDWKTITRDSQLFFYCIMQLIMAPLMLFMLFGVMYPKMGMEEEVMGTMLYSMGVLFMVIFSIGTNYVATSSITRENRKFYLMKIIPVPYEMQIRAKVNLAYIFTFVTIIISAIVLVVLGVKWYVAVIIGIPLLILGYGFVCWQVRIDLDKPRLNWNTITEGLKNNTSSLVTVLVAFAVGLLLAVVSALLVFLVPVFNLAQWLTVLIYVGAFAVLCLISVLLTVLLKNGLYKKIDYLFDKIEG